MILLQNEDTYCIMQDDYQRIVVLKLGKALITKFANCHLQEVLFDGWKVLTPDEVREFQSWKPIRQASKLKALKRHINV